MEQPYENSYSVKLEVHYLAALFYPISVMCMAKRKHQLSGSVHTLKSNRIPTA